MKNLLWLFLVIGFWNIGKAQDISALRKDPDIITFKNVMEKLKSHYYKMPPNYTSLITKNSTPEGMKVALKNNGMANADEFVDLIMSQRNAMFRFNKKHPEFAKMEFAKRIKVMKEVLLN